MTQQHGPTSGFRISTILFGSGLALLFLSPLSGLRAQAFYEKWHLTIGGISVSEENTAHSFIDRWVGDDLLPYTADDEDLPENGNPGGTWGAAALDSDGDGVADFRFTSARRCDDDMQTLGSNSEFEHGMFSEGEDWVDYHNADNTGPCTDPAGQGCDFGDDFEHNDGLSSWEDQASALWYNNARRNQRGLGGSKYYFEWKDAALNPGYFDEVQKWRKGLQFQRNFNNGELPERRFVRGHDATLKGLLIPVPDIQGLETGDLDVLFGWYDGDMADYVKDTLFPRLDDSSLMNYPDNVTCAKARPSPLPEGILDCPAETPPAPVSHIMILQGEFSVTIRNDANSLTSSKYFGMEPTSDVPNADGFLPSDAVYRWCHILLLWEDPNPDPLSNLSPAIALMPADGVAKNLWARDVFNRKSVDGSGIADSLGYLQLGCTPVAGPNGEPPADCWQFLPDLPPPNSAGCAQDRALILPDGSGPTNSWVQLPVIGVPSLDSVAGKIYAEMDLNIADEDGAENLVQMVLTRGDKPVAFAEIKHGTRALIGLGGTGLGPVTPGLTTARGADPLAIPNIPNTYTRFVLVLDGAGGSLDLIQDGVAAATLKFAGDKLVETRVDGLRVWCASGTTGGDNTIALDQLAILQGVPAVFTRGDANNDGTFDISDAVFSLSFQFLGEAPPACADSADYNDDGAIDISDPVSQLGTLFLGEPPPPEPFASCGLDPTPDLLGCGRFIGCE